MAVREISRPAAFRVARFTADYTAVAGKLTTVTVPLEVPAGWTPVSFRRVGLGSSPDTAVHGFFVSGAAAYLYVANGTGKDITGQTATVDVLFMPSR